MLYVQRLLLMEAKKKKNKNNKPTRDDKRKRAKLPLALSSLVFLVATRILREVLFFKK